MPVMLQVPDMKVDGTFRVAVRRYDPFEAAIRLQWESFESRFRTGLKLQAEPYDLGPLSEALFKPHDRCFDLIFLNTDWVAAAHRDNCLIDLALYLEKDPPDDFPDGWTPSLLRLQNIEGFIAGFPYHDGPECLIFRRDLFEDACEKSSYQELTGHELKAPGTWHEFHQIARFFHRPSRGLYGTIFAGFPDGHNSVYDFLLQLWSRGGDLFSNSGSLQLDTPQAHAALGFYRSILLDKNAVHPRSREMDSVQSGLAFAAGETAMMVNWFGFAAMCETMPGSATKGRIDVASVPHAENCAPVSLNVYWLLGIPISSRNPDLAYAFLRHCATVEMDKLLTLQGGIGCRLSTWVDADVARIAPFFDRLPQLHENARELPRRPDWPAIAHRIDKLVIQAIESRDSVAWLLKHA